MSPEAGRREQGGSRTRAQARAADSARARFHSGEDPAGSPDEEGFAYGRGWSRLSDDDERIVRRYYPIFENLILFVLNSRRWVRNFRRFVREETRYRAWLVVQGFLLLAVSTAFVFGAAFMLVFGFFFLFKDLTGSATVAAFLNALLGLVFAGGLFLGLLAVVRRLGSFTRHQDEESEMPGFRRRRAARRAESADRD